MTSEPVLVLYKSETCFHCTKLTSIWPSVTAAVAKEFPKMRVFVISAKDQQGKFDENVAPKDLIRYGKWFPMLLLVPGRLWDRAMSNLGPTNSVQLKEGVQVMNGYWDNNELKFQPNYDTRTPDAFVNWLKSALENEEFKRVQTGANMAVQTGANMVVPTISNHPQQIQPIQPSILSSFVKPTNTLNSHMTAGPFEISYEEHTTCSMRIISRPK